MKIGLTGDTHNNLKNVAKICDIFNSHNLDFVIHTGDISLPKTLYAFDKLKSEIELNLDTNNLVLKKIYATSGKANIFARGEVDLKAKEINATYAVKEASFSEVKRVLAPLLKDVSITTNEIHGLWDLNGRLSGKPSVEGLIVDGNFKGKNNYSPDSPNQWFGSP